MTSGDWSRWDVQLLTVREVARRAAVAAATVRRWAAAGRFPERPGGGPGAVRTPGGHFRFHEDAVDAHWPQAK